MLLHKYSKKKGKLSTSHRYDLLPLLPSGPGGVWRELVVYDFPTANVLLFPVTAKLSQITSCKVTPSHVVKESLSSPEP